MDIESVYLLGGVFVISAVILLIIDYLFKNKSYEDVVAEQKQLSNALHSLNQQRTKVKDKKLKKATKKLKEKKNSLTKDENDTIENSEENDSQKSGSNGIQKHHVEFSEATVIEETIKETKIQPKEVRPILVNKNAPVVEDKTEVLPSNNFEKLHHTDELEVLNANAVKEEVIIKDKKKNKQNIENEPPAESKKKLAKQNKEKETLVKTEQVEKPPTDAPHPAEVIPPVKEKKKKKSELNAVQHFAEDKHGVHLSHIMPLVRKAEMSRVEVQILIDMLLNKQQDAPVIEDWSEGKGDPVQKLKKQLAEKEKQVQELQEALTGSQARLREVRSEQSNERSQLTHSLREKEEALKHKILESQNFDNSMQGIQLQYMQKQEQFNEETKKARKFMEECEALKFQLKQMEMSIQEDKLTIGKLSAELGEHQKHRNMENSAFERNLLQNQQLQIQYNNLKDDHDKLTITSRELMEQISMFKNINAEYNQVKSDIRILEDKDRIKSKEISSLQLHKEEAEQKLMSEKKLWEMKAKTLQNEKLSAIKEIEVFKTECFNLKNQCADLEAHKNKLSEEKKMLQESKTDNCEDKIQFETKINDLNNELTMLRTQIDEINNKHKAEFDDAKIKLSNELEDYKIKNNELRQKNWKVMEALNEYENKCKTLSQNSTNNLETVVSTTKREEQEKNMLFVQRLFPEIESHNNISYEQWQEKIRKSIQEYISKLSAQPAEIEDSAVVQEQNSRYRKIIDEMENVLNALQKNIEEKEKHWKNELRMKEELIDDLRIKIEIDEKEVHKNVSKNNENNVAMNNCNHTSS